MRTMPEHVPNTHPAELHAEWPALRTGHANGDASATVRLAELVRRCDPAEALRLLATVEPTAAWHDLDADTVRASTLLDLGQFDEVRTLLPFLVEGPRTTLIVGRLHLASGELEQADAALSAIIPTEDPEIEVEARAARRGLGVTRGQNVAAELDADLVQRRAWLEARYCDGLEDAHVGPVPLVVHGVARAHSAEPDRFVGAILALGSLDWRLGSRMRALLVVWFGLHIGERLHGPLPNLRRFVDQLLRALTTSERREVLASLRVRPAGSVQPLVQTDT